MRKEISNRLNQSVTQKSANCGFPGAPRDVSTRRAFSAHRVCDPIKVNLTISDQKMSFSTHMPPGGAPVAPRYSKLDARDRLL